MRIASWRRVRDVFDRVAETSPSERAALLDDLAGGDDELKHEVLALLGALDEDDDRFERGGAALAHSAIAEEATLTGLEIAPYRLLRRVGRGGMGDVYLAERCDGESARRVAIKLIKPGMDTDSVIRRFRQERQILAGLAHPSIAALLDGGVTAEGRPYLVMEYVEGEPITTYCERRQLPLEDRVRLVQDVCAAVHFAHQNLVIHRDLKPANILVTADGSVKLLDFGVAKLLRPQGMATATQTMFGGRAFTPSYASPEQVRGEAVTTASDTYSLGVILYELLTGRLPFDVETGSLADVLQAVSTAEPTRPSEAIPDEITQPQPVRAIRRALRRRLAGDLDNIVLMAIRKEAARRYASVHELAEDLRRFLEQRPVLARTDTLAYRAAKFIRRNRAGVAAAAGITLALGAGATGTIMQSQRASMQKAIAVQRLQDVRELANSLLFEVHDAIADLPGATEARRLILARGFDNLEQLAAQVGTDPDLEWELAEAFLRVGLVQGQPTGPSLGDLDAARRSYTRAIEIARLLTAARPDDLRARRTLALSLEKLGDVDAWTGSVDEGVRHATTALGLYSSIADAWPDSARHQLSVVISLVKLGDLTGHPVFPNLGRPDESLVHYQAALERLRQPPLLASTDWGPRRYGALVQERIGMMHRVSGRYAEARESFGLSLARRVALAAEQPSNAEIQRDVAVTRQDLCEVERALRRPGPALEHCRAAFALYEQMHATDPRNAQARSDVAAGARSLAAAQAAVGDAAPALRTLERGIAVLRPALDDEPTHRPNRLSLARLLAQHTLLARTSGRPAPFASAARAAFQTLRAEGVAEAEDSALITAIAKS